MIDTQISSDIIENRCFISIQVYTEPVQLDEYDNYHHQFLLSIMITITSKRQATTSNDKQRQATTSNGDYV